MGVMVLHLNQRKPFLTAPRQGVGGGKIVWVQVTDQTVHLDAEEPLEMGDLSLIVGQGLHIFQVADVLAQEKGPALGQGEGRLLLRAAGQNPGTVRLQKQGLRGIAAAAPQEIVLAVKDPKQGVVAPGDNVPVVHQETVSDPFQLLQGLPVVVHHGTVRPVGAGHHQGVEALHQQVVQRRIGQHHAQIPVLTEIRADSVLFPQQHNGPTVAGQTLLLLGRELAQRADCLHTAAHQGKGLFVPVFPPAQLPQGLLPVDFTGQVEATQSLHRHNPLLPQTLRGQGDGVALHWLSLPVQIVHLGPAGGTAVGLGVVAAVADVPVFRLALPTHGKGSHGGQRAVVGDIPDDGKTGAAVGAVEKGVTVAPVPRVSELPETVLTDPHIGTDEGVVLPPLLAAPNGKALIVLQRSA